MALIAMLFITSLPTAALANTDRHQAQIPVTGGTRTVTWTEIPLVGTYVIRGLTAQQVLGRPFGTLSQFADAMSDYAGTDVIIFPVNFFVTGTTEIVGGIFSRGQIVSAGPQPWLNFGVGFTQENEMSLFQGRFNDGVIYGYHWDSPRKDHIYSAFNIFPHFIADGNRLPIQPRPGLTQAFINQSAQRAFMGQRPDGTLVVGNVTGASLPQTQDVAAHFGLVNATNLDGGASAGIWRNGTYITRPGRQLPAVMYVTNTRGAGSQPEPDPDPQPPGLPFTDVGQQDPFFDAVSAVYERGIMRGTSATAFSPHSTLRRNMVATILHRIADEPEVPFRPIFSDVGPGEWYSVPITWGHDMEVMQGVGGGRFAPNDQITGEQLATMMHRFALGQGLDVSVPASFTMPDIPVSYWAQAAMRWATYNGFINMANPGVPLTRAETAVFVHQFMLQYGH